MEVAEQLRKTGDHGSVLINKRKVSVSHTTKIYFPGKHITKGDVMAYYYAIADYILPHLQNRPMTLKRHLNGITSDSFFQKNAGENVPGWIKTFKSHAASSDRDIEYIICNNAATLIYLANLGCIEMNPWLSTIKKPDHPTYIIIDIDPSPKNSFDEVIETANAVKEVADKAGLSSYCKTSGASGLHVYVPFGDKYSFDELRPLCELIAQRVHELVPAITTLERSLKKRGDKIYIDYLQNNPGQTVASVYSLRPVEEASVSTPLEWNELKKRLHPGQFNIFNIQQRLTSKGDLFKEVLTKRNNLNRALKALGD